jgi:isopenicillin N synthase-like dioxygenase
LNDIESRTRGTLATVPASHVPKLDLARLTGADRTRAVAETAAAFATHGYVLLQGHGIAPRLFARVYDVIERLFALSPAIKRACAPEAARGLAGYVLGDPNEGPTESEETTEMWQVQRPFADPSARHRAIPENVWPDALPELREPALALFQGLDECTLAVLAALDEAYELGPDSLVTSARDGWAILRLMRYPPRSPTTPPERLRASPHDDMCLLACYTGGSRRGLEVMQPDGSWSEVPAGEEWLLVGAGSMLEAATNGLVRPATHRVRYSETDPGVRYATPFFLLPRPDADLGPRAALETRVGVRRYPTRTAAEMLGMATGWGDDPATARHESWRTGSPPPDGRVGRISAEGGPTLRVQDIELASIAEAARAIDALLAGELGLVVVRRAFSAEQMLALRRRLERGEPPLSRFAFPEKFHARYYGANLDMAGSDLREYFDLAERFERDLRGLGGEEIDLGNALPRLLGALASGSELGRPKGPDGRPYLIASIRELLQRGYIPPHCECEQIAREPYRHLGPLLDRKTLLSWYVMIAPPEAGGELVVHELRWHEVRERYLEHERSEVNELLASERRPLLRVRAQAGDLLIFDGGRLIHEVRPVERGTRWTLGGFVARDAFGQLLHWA